MRSEGSGLRMDNHNMVIPTFHTNILDKYFWSSFIAIPPFLMTLQKSEYSAWGQFVSLSMSVVCVFLFYPGLWSVQKRFDSNQDTRICINSSLYKSLWWMFVMYTQLLSYDNFSNGELDLSSSISWYIQIILVQDKVPILALSIIH